MALEPIVRPFQAPTPINTNTIVIDETLLPAQRARLRWTGVGTLPAPGVNLNVQTCADKYKENTRKSTKVKVTNPDDGSQYVIVESVDQIFFNHQNNSEDTIFGQELAAFNNSLGGDLGNALSFSFDVPAQCSAEYDLKSPYDSGQG